MKTLILLSQFSVLLLINYLLESLIFAYKLYDLDLLTKKLWTFGEGS